MLHRPLRLEGFLLSTVQEKTGGWGMSTPGMLVRLAPQERWVQPNWFLVIHWMSKALRLTLDSAPLRFIMDIRHIHGAERAPQHPTAAGRTSPSLRWLLQVHGGSALCGHWCHLLKTIKWAPQPTVHSCPSHPENEVAGSAKNTGEGAGGGS